MRGNIMNLREWNKLSLEKQEYLFNKLKEHYYKNRGEKNENKK